MYTIAYDELQYYMFRYPMLLSLYMHCIILIFVLYVDPHIQYIYINIYLHSPSILIDALIELALG